MKQPAAQPSSLLSTIRALGRQAEGEEAERPMRNPEVVVEVEGLPPKTLGEAEAAEGEEAHPLRLEEEEVVVVEGAAEAGVHLWRRKGEGAEVEVVEEAEGEARLFGPRLYQLQPCSHLCSQLSLPCLLQKPGLLQPERTVRLWRHWNRRRIWALWRRSHRASRSPASG